MAYSETTNYDLRKPATTDPVDITLLNWNMDTIDAQMKANNDAAVQLAGASQSGRMSAADYIKLNKQEIPANSNLNNYTTPGMYYCNSAAIATTLTNCPATQPFLMNVYELSSTIKIQEIVEISASSGQIVDIYRRVRSSSTWYVWDAFVRNSVTFSSIRNTTNTSAGSGSVQKIGKEVFMGFAATLAGALSASTWVELGTLPEEYRPSSSVTAVVVTTTTTPIFLIMNISSADGSISVKSDTAISSGSKVSGSVMWFVP